MQLSHLSALLAAGGVASAAALPQTSPTPSVAPALPLSAFEFHKVKPLSLDEVLHNNFSNGTPPAPSANAAVAHDFAAAATCNVKIRKEWDNYSTAERTAYLNAIKCLMGKPASGQFSGAKSRYEDLVALHQTLTDNVHGNAKFLLWHRYFLWTFESVLHDECGFDSSLAIPWFDETKYAGNFPASSIFSNDWYGAVDTGGACVGNGQFAGLTLNIGPGPNNQQHCLARNNDNSDTVNTGSSFVNGCNARTDYADMAGCSEGSAHAWGHNGIGAVMADVYASPSDPVFWLHHAFIDRNFRIWQNADANRLTYVDGKDHFGNPLTMGTTVLVGNIRPNVLISDILNTLGDKLCYRYDY